MASVTGVINLIKDYIDINHIEGKERRFKLAIGVMEGKVLLSTKSYDSIAKVKKILDPYVHSDEKVIDFKVRPGVTYKINGKKFYKNYVEVCVYVSGFPRVGSDEYRRFIDLESRELKYLSNSRDKRIARYFNVESILNRGE